MEATPQAEGTRAFGTPDDPYHPDAFRHQGYAVIDALADHLARTARADGPVLAYRPPDEQLARWPATIPEEPGPALLDLLPQILSESHHLHHPRSVGHQVSAPLPGAALAELVAALLNNGTAEYEMGPVSNAMERRLVDWLGLVLGMPTQVEGLFTSGGSAGNLTALAAARQAIPGLDIWEQGLAAAQPLAILVPEQAHYSNDRAARILGLGVGGAVAVRCDDRFRLDPTALPEAHRQAERAGRRVFAVVASACSTSTGAFDPLEPIAEYAAENDLWFHVDGAHGAAAALSPRYRHLVAGMGRADSVIVDAHKMMQMPALVTAVLFGRPGVADRAFPQHQHYVGFRPNAEGEDGYAWWDSGLRTLECTKRMMALELYTALSEHGTRRIADHVTRTFDLARSFAVLLDEAADFELAVEPEANIVCFRHVPPGARDLDDLQVAVRDEIVQRGTFYLTKTRLDDRQYLRTTIMNARTDEDDLADLLTEIRAVGRSIVEPGS